MPFKDLKKKKEYHRKWIAAKRAGLNTSEKDNYSKNKLIKFTDQEIFAEAEKRKKLNLIRKEPKEEGWLGWDKMTSLRLRHKIRLSH